MKHLLRITSHLTLLLLIVSFSFSCEQNVLSPDSDPKTTSIKKGAARDPAGLQEVDDYQSIYNQQTPTETAEFPFHYFLKITLNGTTYDYYRGYVLNVYSGDSFKIEPYLWAYNNSGNRIEFPDPSNPTRWDSPSWFAWTAKVYHTYPNGARELIPARVYTATYQDGTLNDEQFVVYHSSSANTPSSETPPITLTIRTND